jgi:hypothetical protein
MCVERPSVGVDVVGDVDATSSESVGIVLWSEPAREEERRGRSTDGLRAPIAGAAFGVPTWPLFKVVSFSVWSLAYRKYD